MEIARLATDSIAPRGSKHVKDIQGDVATYEEKRPVLVW